MTLTRGQHSFNGITFGEGTYVLVEAVEGLFGSDVRRGDTPMPRGHGSVGGQHFEVERSIFYDIAIYGDDRDATMRAVRDAFRVVEDADLPLEFNVDDTTYRILARPLRMPVRRRADSWRIPRTTVALIASDPRIYSADETTTVVPLYSTAGGGVNAPLNAPINTSAGTTVEAVVVNDGNSDAHPTVRFHGPATEVVLTNVTSGDTLTVATAIASGQVLTYDGTAYVTASGEHVVSLDGAGRYGAWVERIPFVLPPGESVLRFTADDAAQAVVYHRSTWIS